MATGVWAGDTYYLSGQRPSPSTPDGARDFAGMNAAYNKYFGTADQPNTPARTTVQVAALVTAGGRSRPASALGEWRLARLPHPRTPGVPPG